MVELDGVGEGLHVVDHLERQQHVWGESHLWCSKTKVSLRYLNRVDEVEFLRVALRFDLADVAFAVHDVPAEGDLLHLGALRHQSWRINTESKKSNKAQGYMALIKPAELPVQASTSRDGDRVAGSTPLKLSVSLELPSTTSAVMGTSGRVAFSRPRSWTSISPGYKPGRTVVRLFYH